jgi:hypothetical protein
MYELSKHVKRPDLRYQIPINILMHSINETKSFSCLDQAEKGSPGYRDKLIEGAESVETLK